MNEDMPGGNLVSSSSQMEQIQHACECHVCYQDSSSSALGHPGAPLPPSRLHGAPAPHFLTSDAKAPPSHPALQLYPHIHGHLPLHTLSHLPRPLLHPTLYPPSPPLSHNKVSGKHHIAYDRNNPQI